MIVIRWYRASVRFCNVWPGSRIRRPSVAYVVPPLAASTAAVLMALDEDPALTGRFQHARSCLRGKDLRRRRADRAAVGLADRPGPGLGEKALPGDDRRSSRRRDPQRLSPAQWIRTLRASLRADCAAPGPSPAALERALGRCLKDTYPRRKPKGSRHRITSTNTTTLRLKPPKVYKATLQDQQDVQKYHPHIAA
jgi:hypothetical protein